MMGKIPSFLLVLFACTAFMAQSGQSLAGNNEELTAEQVVAAHLKSLGNIKLLSQVQSKTFSGTTDVNFIQGMNGTLVNGKAGIISEGPKLSIIFKFDDKEYPGEYFAYDGKDVTVGYIKPGQRSPIADFIFRYNRIMKEGLLGGTLSTSWPLSDIQNRKVDLKCRKSKVDGRELYELEYRPKESMGNIKVRIYFDPTTFYHVRTEYLVREKNDATVGNNVGIDQFGDSAAVKAANSRGTMAIGATREDSFYTLVEKFDDFKKVKGMVFPYRYSLEYSLDGNGQAFLAHWTFNANNLAFNAANLNEKIFQAQK